MIRGCVCSSIQRGDFLLVDDRFGTRVCARNAANAARRAESTSAIRSGARARARSVLYIQRRRWAGRLRLARKREPSAIYKQKFQIYYGIIQIIDNIYEVIIIIIPRW